MCGFSNAVVFQTINQPDISHVEKYIGFKLPTMLENVKKEEKMHFFGRYTENPTEFKFNPGELRMITKIKETVLLKGVKYFDVKKDDYLSLHELAKFELCSTSIGFLFKSLPSTIDPPNETICKPEFIDISDYEKIVKVQLKSQSQTTDSLCVNDKNAFQIDRPTEIPPSNDSLFTECDEINQRMDYYADSFYTQLYVQNLRNNKCTAMHKEELKNFIVDIKSRKNVSPLVKICPILRDGNCLFGSLAHQLFNVQVNSTEHKLETNKLRQEVIEHIVNRISTFQHDLIDRMLSDSDFHFNATDLKSSCVKFVNQRLAQNGYWGGMETLKAVAEIYSTNILIVNEDGSSNLGNRFNPKYERTIILSFQPSNRRLKQRDHYDSVAEISENLLSKFARDAIESFKLQSDLINSTDTIAIE